jgi:hypothetical protein
MVMVELDLDDDDSSGLVDADVLEETLVDSLVD